MKVAVTGSFDPITLGHMDVIERARRVFGAVVVGVGVVTGKSLMFSLEARVSMVKAACADLRGVEVFPMDGLAVDFCTCHGAQAIVRGARSGSDFDAEWSMARFNHSLKGVDTVIFPASEELAFLSSTFVRSVVQAGGDVSRYVPSAVLGLMEKEL